MCKCSKGEESLYRRNKPRRSPMALYLNPIQTSWFRKARNPVSRAVAVRESMAVDRNGTTASSPASLHATCFKRLGSDSDNVSDSASLLQAQQAQTLVLNVAGKYITLIVPGMLHECWVEYIASICSVPHSDVHIMSQDSIEQVAELLAACPLDSIPLLLCPTLLGSPLVSTPSGSGPPFVAETKELLLQGNVTVVPSALTTPPCVPTDVPQPYPSNACFCKIRALVVARRRVGKRLVFVDLAPLASAADPDALGNARRACWQHPRTHDLTRLQMIMGDTISQSLGQQSASKLMRSVKPGCVVDCVGSPAKDAEDNQHGSSSAICLEFVALSVQIVAPRVVSSRGNALPLQLIATLNPLAQMKDLQDGGVSSFLGSPALNAVAQRKRRQKPAPARPIKKYKVVNNVKEVCTIEDVKHMHEELVACLPTVTSQSSYWDFVPIGMDAEWEPYARAEPATPVATLQISSRNCAYVMDMQALVRSVRRNRCERADDDAEEIPGSGEQHKRWPDTHPHLCNLTPSEQAVSDLLRDLFAAPGALKLGFAFHNDLHQLVNSFPHLPVFGALPVRLRTPRRVHAPALHSSHRSPAGRVQRQSLDDGRNVQAAGRPVPNAQVPDDWACMSDSEPETSDGAEPDMLNSQQSGSVTQPCNVQQGSPVAQMDRTPSVGPAEVQEVEELASSQASLKANQGSDAASEAIGSFVLSSFIDCSALEALCRGRSRQAGRRESLGAVTNRVLGKALDKREQVSSWSTRPLRKSQIEYAAGDAHVLVSICDTLASSAVEAPRAQAIWRLRSGLHLLQTMYPKPNTVDETIFVFARDSDKEEWAQWRERAWQ